VRLQDLEGVRGGRGGRVVKLKPRRVVRRRSFQQHRFCCILTVCGALQEMLSEKLARSFLRIASVVRQERRGDEIVRDMTTGLTSKGWVERVSKRQGKEETVSTENRDGDREE
jgi:hypothetical protein